MKKEIDIDERVLDITVDDEVIEKVLSGQINQLNMDISDDNYKFILENIDGHLLLVIDKMPEAFHGCYLYNRGKFPYAIKQSLEFIMLKSENKHCLTRIIGINTVPGTRFRFKGNGQPSVEDPKGDSCIWEVQFEIIPIPEEARYYLMRWNPSISSFTGKDYEECISNMSNGMFRMNWSIYEWQEARRGDYFYMMRTGDDKAGIVFTGQFLTDPYPGEDWAGSNKRRMYVDLLCFGPSEPESAPRIPMEKLQSAIPSYEWSKGHSGALLSDEIVEKMSNLFEDE